LIDSCTHFRFCLPCATEWTIHDIVRFFGSIRIEGQTNGRPIKENGVLFWVGIEGQTNGRPIKENGYSAYCTPISHRTARALSTTRYVLRLLHTNFFTNSQHVPVPVYIYDTRTIHVRYTYDTRTIGSDRIGSNHSLWFDAGTYDVRNGDRDLKKGKRQKENNTWDSNVVPHRSTNQARTCLTSLSGREAVLSCWYGRSQNVNLSQPLQSNISFYQISQSIKYAMEKVPGTV
jgi:hypothetical protein